MILLYPLLLLFLHCLGQFHYIWSIQIVLNRYILSKQLNTLSTFLNPSNWQFGFWCDLSFLINPNPANTDRIGIFSCPFWVFFWIAVFSFNIGGQSIIKLQVLWKKFKIQNIFLSLSNLSFSFWWSMHWFITLITKILFDCKRNQFIFQSSLLSKMYHFGYIWGANHKC